MQKSPILPGLRGQLPGIVYTLGLVGLVTVALYLILVLIAAVRWGMIPSIVAAFCGIVASAFFFFEPRFSLQIKDPHEVLNLILFTFTAIVVSQLATRLKHELEV